MGIAATLALAGGLLLPGTAQAEEVSTTGKGIAGGALLGAEVVVITESLVGVKPTWAYLGGGGAGAVAGGVGGFLIERAVSDGHIPVYMLAGGLALIIPGVVLTLNATRYKPTEGAQEDKAPTNAPTPDPGKQGGSAVVGAEQKPAPAPAPSGSGTGTTPAPAPSGGAPKAPVQAPTSLLELNHSEQTTLRIGVPAPEVRPVFTTAERKQYGMGNVTEMRLPVVRFTF
jgi:hypothetical protein